MRFISRVLAAALLLFCCSVTATARQAGLPSSWDGVWKGATTLNWASGKVEAAAMELHVSPVAAGPARNWKVVYVFADRREVREYEIKPAEVPGAGRLVIDEKNGFLIDNYLSGETLYSRFTINGNLVTTRFELRGDRIEVELTMFDVSKPRVTKLTGGNFEVASFSPKYVQRGTLRREPPARKNDE
ncbi:MAG TPA: hypothetical protein VF297_23945 [Pyrinomonadaceae bacterium]